MDSQIPPHIEQELDFDSYGGKERVYGSLDADEVIDYASHGWLEEVPAVPGGRTKKREGLLTITNRRVLLIRCPGLLRKDPEPIEILFETIYNCGPHKDIPHVVVVMSHSNHRVEGQYIVLPSDTHESTAIIWGATIRDGAEAAGGPASAPPGL